MMRLLLAFAMAALWLWLVVIEASAQDAQERTLPVHAAHPTTGEPGTWIPQWLERDHVLEAAELEHCRTERETLQVELRERQAEVAELRKALAEQDDAMDAAEGALATPPPQPDEGGARWELGVGLAVVLSVFVIAQAF